MMLARGMKEKRHPVFRPHPAPGFRINPIHEIDVDPSKHRDRA
jgi:hypothetical protein